MKNPVDYDDAVRAYIKEVVGREDAHIEQACEASLQGGKYGVLVTTKHHVDLDNLSANRVLRAEVSEDVPYGQIHWREEP